MFLNENANNVAVENTEAMGYDPIYAMQIMQEATEDWNDICMKMIKLEHTAIMKEDTNLLQEGVKESLNRFKNNVTVLGRKIIEFLERVRVQWSKIQAAVASKFLNTDMINALLKNYNEKAKIQINKKLFDKALNQVSTFSKVTSALAAQIKLTAESEATTTTLSAAKESSNTKIEKIMAAAGFTDAADAGSTEEVAITKDLIQRAIAFLKNRPVAIKNIEVMKKATTDIQNILIKKLSSPNAKVSQRNALVDLQRGFNKLIISINKQTSTAIKICNAAKPNKKNGVKDKNVKDFKKTQKEQKGVYYESANADVKSVLDDFA